MPATMMIANARAVLRRAPAAGAVFYSMPGVRKASGAAARTRTSGVAFDNVTLSPSDYQVSRGGGGGGGGGGGAQCSGREAFRRSISRNEDVLNDLVYCLSFASEEKDFVQNFAELSPNIRIKGQLLQSNNQLRIPSDNDLTSGLALCKNGTPASSSKRIQVYDGKLPRKLEDALRPSKRAVVITEAKKPFAIFNVNQAWEELCGYKYVESKGKTLGSLLQGPETDEAAATALIAKLLQGEEAGTTLINYTKSGRAFRNRIRVGPLEETGKDGKTRVTHFVGILQEI